MENPLKLKLNTNIIFSLSRSLFPCFRNALQTKGVREMKLTFEWRSQKIKRPLCPRPYTMLKLITSIGVFRAGLYSLHVYCKTIDMCTILFENVSDTLHICLFALRSHLARDLRFFN